MASGTAKIAQRCEDAKTHGSALDLRSCDLMALPLGVFALVQEIPLRSLDLSFNAISKVTPKISQLFLLTELNLSNNRISTLPDELGDLVQLTSLNLSHNKLTTLPPCLASLVNLAHLNCQNNAITHVDVETTLQPLEALRVLQLDNNSIHTSVVPKLLQLPCSTSIENNRASATG